MKKILNYIKNHTFYSTLIFIIIFIAIEFLLSLFSMMYRSLIYIFAIAILIIGTTISILKSILKISKKWLKISSLCLFSIFLILFALFFVALSAFRYQPTYVVNRDNEKYVAYVESIWDLTYVYYYKYINPFVVSKKLSIEEFYDTGNNPFKSKYAKECKGATTYYAKDGKTRIKTEIVNDEKNDNIDNTILENNITEEKVYAESCNLQMFSQYFGKSVSYSKTVELLDKICNEYAIYLWNSEGKTGSNPGHLIYLSTEPQSDKMLQETIVSSINSYLTVLENGVEATYNISIKNHERYGEHICVERNDLKMLRGSFKLNSTIDGMDDNYDYIEIFKPILCSEELINTINEQYNIDINNNVKIWSLTTNNFLMNIGCGGISETQYKEYSNFVFNTFKDMVLEKYKVDLDITQNFTLVIQ